VKELVRNSLFKSRNSNTLVFQLPSLETAHFSSLFDALDKLQEQGEVVSYSLSISTLEDVFVRYANGNPFYDMYTLST